MLENSKLNVKNCKLIIPGKRETVNKLLSENFTEFAKNVEFFS